MDSIPRGSKCTGNLSPGCKSCHQGRSTVIFITGRCNATCFYCPVGMTRMFKNQAYANEKPINRIEELFEEIIMCKSKAASFTGGDPLLEHEKCHDYAQALKNKFGSDFYIHLYTPGREGSPEIFEKLSEVIDEIRFHPKNPDDVLKMQEAMKYDWNIGIEIPATPGIIKQNFFRNYVNDYAKSVQNYEKKFPFFNLNELEISERNFNKLFKRGFISDQDDNLIGISVEGSSDEALKIMDYIQTLYPFISVHFCPASQKDGIQLPNRLLHRAHSVMLPSDFVIKDWSGIGQSRGLLIRGVLRFKDNDYSKGNIENRLKKLKERLITQFEIPLDQISIDLKKQQLLTRADFLEEFADEIKNSFPNLIVGMVEEYPTDERLQTSFYSF
ncbi:MAG: 7-carboxy-7-deazaguanine synthase [Candidatus Heimdallarchaeota archaeon LC_3]|nr:MAG: 7-carboxy-7-deazaguanine synthase [Candidatus Heimdallarchaeota archaeon LC_3]